MPTFNPKKSQHVYCWRCDHFQRFDQGEEPESCAGQCRYDSPLGNLINDDEPSVIQAWWPFIEDSVNTFCHAFTPTLEKNLPPAPEPCVPECPHSPREYSFGLWNKKAPENIMCWTCDHFARFYEDPSQDDLPSNTSFGTCRRLPPASETYLYLPDADLDLKMQGFSWNFEGGVFWCHRWEVATHTVPPLPDAGEPQVMRYTIGGSGCDNMLEIMNRSKPKPKAKPKAKKGKS